MTALLLGLCIVGPALVALFIRGAGRRTPSVWE